MTSSGFEVTTASTVAEALRHISSTPFDALMLEEFLSKVIVYTPEAMAKGSMWWWVLPLAPGVPERLIVGHEREFLTWFYEGATADPASITEASITETLRTFAGSEGVLGALGVYRAAFTTIEQTTPLKKKKVKIPVLAIGGEKALGAKVAQMVEAVAKNVNARVIPACGHFIPEEQPASSCVSSRSSPEGSTDHGKPDPALCPRACRNGRRRIFVFHSAGLSGFL